MTGREFVQALAAGDAQPPPMARLIGLRVAEVGEGVVTIACEADEAFYNPMGVVHGGLLCTLLDTAMGLSLQTLMDPGMGLTTIEIKVNFLRAVRATDGELTAVGRVVKRGRRVAFAEADARDQAGNAVATATSSLLIAERP
jgi:uncharacterized protein (TIGR00369 family)